MMSEGYICVQSVTFWWPIRCSNHWATWTEMMNKGYICVRPVTVWWPVRYSITIELHGLSCSEGYICVQHATLWWPMRYRFTWNFQWMLLPRFSVQNRWHTMVKSTWRFNCNRRPSLLKVPILHRVQNSACKISLTLTPAISIMNMAAPSTWPAW